MATKYSFTYPISRSISGITILPAPTLHLILTSSIVAIFLAMALVGSTIIKFIMESLAAYAEGVTVVEEVISSFRNAKMRLALRTNFLTNTILTLRSLKTSVPSFQSLANPFPVLSFAIVADLANDYSSVVLRGPFKLSAGNSLP